MIWDAYRFASVVQKIMDVPTSCLVFFSFSGSFVLKIDKMLLCLQSSHQNFQKKSCVRKHKSCLGKNRKIQMLL